MKKFLICFCLIFSCSAVSVFASVIPDNTYYVKLNTSNFGTVTCYIPYNYGKNFTDSGNSIVNISSSNITCIGIRNGNQYSVRFPSYDKALIRYNSDWDILNVTSYETNLPLLSEVDFSLMSQETVIYLIILLIGGMLLCLRFMKR